MPAEKIVSQFNKSDLFAVFMPGFIIFTFAYVAYRTDTQTQSLWMVLQHLTDQVQQRPAWLLFILFAAYLLGSLVRAIPVTWVERILPPFKKRSFPSPDVLRELVDTLANYASAARLDPHNLPDVSADVPGHVYNYWKDLLCVGTAAGFDYYQTFEMRVRFFTGMLWAGLLGVLLGLWIVVRNYALWHPVGFTMCALSLVILLTFGLNFRRVRRQEARALLLIFTAYLQNRVQHPSQSGTNLE